MRNIALLLILAATLLLAGCEGTFVKLRVAGELPDPVIQLERGLAISEFSVHKVTRFENNDIRRTEFWWVVIDSGAENKFMDVIRYGRVPRGYYERAKFKPLDFGYYSVSVAATVHSMAVGAFVVAKTKDGKARVMNLLDSHAYGDEILKCIGESGFIEEDVRRCVPSGQWAIQGAT